MTRSTTLGLIGLAVATTTGAMAQGTVPVTSDLRRAEGVDARIERRMEDRTGRPGAAGSGGLPVQSDPSGVAGFNGPPGTIGDSVNSLDPLPQGVSGADVR